MTPLKDSISSGTDPHQEKDLNIESYFRSKGPFAALTKAEALVLGIPFPLRSGWLRRHGACAITPGQAQILSQLTPPVLDKRARQGANQLELF